MKFLIFLILISINVSARAMSPAVERVLREGSAREVILAFSNVRAFDEYDLSAFKSVFKDRMRKPSFAYEFFESQSTGDPNVYVRSLKSNFLVDHRLFPPSRFIMTDVARWALNRLISPDFKALSLMNNLYYYISTRKGYAQQLASSNRQPETRAKLNLLLDNWYRSLHRLAIQVFKPRVFHSFAPEASELFGMLVVLNVPTDILTELEIKKEMVQIIEATLMPKSDFASSCEYLLTKG